MTTGTPPKTRDSRQPVGLILGAGAIVVFLSSLGQTSVSTALPTIVSELGGVEHLTWVVTAYLLASTVGSPISGKLGDLYGRKIILQSAILIFLLGSLVSGLAFNMVMIVIGRVIQGLGAGSLMVVALAVVGDVLPARERGKIQGLFAAVFGVSTVIGPLLGGFLVQHLSWHWIFFLNFPVGLAAFLVITFALHAPASRVDHKIDYAGASLLALVLSALVLATSLGGVTLPWSSPPILALIVIALVSLVLFVIVEARAAEPVLPLTLFANNNFLISNIVGFIIGLAMFASVTFLPYLLQVVNGESPTVSGLYMLAIMAGILAGSVLSGITISRTGRYKALPILSSLLVAVGMGLLATISAQTPSWQLSVYMLVVGLGIGPVMSTSVTAVQNAVPVSMLGVASASVTMFRQIGGSIGVSIFGALFAMGLHARIGDALPQNMDARSLGKSAIAALPPEQRALVLDAFVGALQPIFLSTAIASLLAFAIAFMLKEMPLSTTLHHTHRDMEPDQAAPSPVK